MTAVWRPGAQHKVVDCFSRHAVEDADSDEYGADIDACLMATLAAVNADDDSGETIIVIIFFFFFFIIIIIAVY